MKPFLSANFFSRGRMSDIYGDGHDDDIFLVIGGIIFIFLLCAGAVFLWQAHREKVKKIGYILLGLFALYIFGCVANLVYMVMKDRSSNKHKVEANAIESVVSEESMTAKNHEPLLPEGSSVASNDPWGSFPPAGEINREGKENDFLVATTNNPSYTIYDLMHHAGLTKDNTQFLSESEYEKSNWVRKHYTPQQLHKAYSKLSSAWQTFCRCSGADISSNEVEKYMMHYDMFDTDKPQINDAQNPQLIIDLKRVPLQ